MVCFDQPNLLSFIVIEIAGNDPIKDKKRVEQFHVKMLEPVFLFLFAKRCYPDYSTLLQVNIHSRYVSIRMMRYSMFVFVHVAITAHQVNETQKGLIHP